MNIAIGVFLYFEPQSISNYAECSSKDLYTNLKDRILYQKYVSKKSTWSEIKIAIDALNFLHKAMKFPQKIEIYTDCQSLCDLLGKRKEKLQKNNFTTREGMVLQHANLYKELFSIAEKFQIQIFKMKGHSSISEHSTVEEKIFSILDRYSRKKLRLLLATEKKW